MFLLEPLEPWLLWPSRCWSAPGGDIWHALGVIGRDDFNPYEG